MFAAWLMTLTLFASASPAPAPEDPAAIVQRALALHGQGRYAEAAVTFDKAREAGANRTITLYNAACGYALAGRPDEAFARLTELAESGFKAAPQIASDPDFTSLRGDARFAAVLQRISENIVPCRKDPASRQLDFWAGQWRVVNAQGKEAGQSTITIDLDQCVVLEHWRSGAMQGRSMNAYDPVAKRWKQFWVSGGGDVTLYEGTFSDGAMRLEGTVHSRSTGAAPVRMTLTPLPDGSVRQFGERSADGGKSWIPGYDLRYVRVTPAAEGGPR